MGDVPDAAGDGSAGEDGEYISFRLISDGTCSGEVKWKEERQKVLIDGQLYLMYEGKMYDVRGTQVK